MPLFAIFLLDQTLLASIIQNGQTKYNSFLTLDDFLCSPLWEENKNIPRIIYVETQHSHTIVNFGNLSMIEKFLFWIRKKISRHDSRIMFISYHQAMICTFQIPEALKEGPLLKTTSLFLELFRLIPRKAQKNPSIYYYYQPHLGFWNLGLIGKRVFFQKFIPLVPEDLVRDHLTAAHQYFYQKGIKEKISLVDLGSFYRQESYFSLLESLSLKSGLRFFLSTSQKLIVASLFLIVCFAYTIFSIHTWERQLKVSQETLCEMQRKIYASYYQNLRNQFQQEKVDF